MTFSINKYVPEFLKKNRDKRYTAREIASWIMETYPDDVEEKRKRSQARKLPLNTDGAMLQQIVAEIGSQRPNIQKKYPSIKTTEGRPRKFYYTEKTAEDEVEDDSLPIDGDAQTLVLDEDPSFFSEADLYPILSEYLKSEWRVYSKRIDERRSKNSRGKGGNKWLFPDLVGMEDLTESWSREIVETAKEYSDKKTRLWSFEVKKIVNNSNVREVFFQSVSNFSWANLGYLVVAEIQGSDTVRELQVLANSHGIGVMKIDVENPSEGQVIIPAQERADVSWGAANRLAEENSDFVDFIRLVRQFYQTGDPRKRDWD